MRKSKFEPNYKITYRYYQETSWHLWMDHEGVPKRVKQLVRYLMKKFYKEQEQRYLEYRIQTAYFGAPRWCLARLMALMRIYSEVESFEIVNLKEQTCLLRFAASDVREKVV